MSGRNILGAGLCAAVLGVAFLGGEGAHHFLNGVGLAIVLAGTLGATILSFPIGSLRSALRVVWNVYRVEQVTPTAVVEALVDIALRSRTEGKLSLESLEENTEVTFLKGALEMLVDGYEESEIRESLVTEMHFFKQRREQHEHVLRYMAQVAPAFGVAGSVVGLIGMLTGLGDTGVILETIPLALTSTLYGVVLGSFVLNPLAESIRSKTAAELLLQRLIIEGVIAIHQERRPLRLERKLLSFLTPSARPASQRSFDEIRSRYRDQRLRESADLRRREAPAEEWVTRSSPPPKQP